jgi:hypothetical protein
MPLIDEVRQMCSRLASFGWRDLLLEHGLDITATNLEQELTKELSAINRRIPGFEDFAFEGKRGIEAGNPARSLLFHAFASSNVVLAQQSENSSAYPTIAELEVIENYVYGVQPPSLQDLQVRAQRQLLAIVVFASEYRPGSETVHRKHADMCFSRTGVARVGTSQALYDSKLRGFLPFVEDEPTAFRVLPARYSAYIAVQRRGNQNSFGPMRFQIGEDEDRLFWVPLHKLFNGTECIRGLNLQVTLNASHINEKLRRIHLVLKDAGWGEPDISQPPFIFTEGIAEFTTNSDFGTGVLVPVVHSNLVEAATYQGKTLTFRVPPNSSTLSSSLAIPPDQQGGRHAPEYVHARHKVLPNGEQENLNERQDVEAAVARGGYDAIHYTDFTGDGWIEAVCPELAVAIPRRVPAYSLVTAPDFFPNCDQRELLEWEEQSVPSRLRDNLWVVPPLTLSDNRFAPNLELKGADFLPEDKTVTAIVSLPVNGSVQQMPLDGSPTMRHSYLPDGASGVFAPGWDVSYDRTTEGVEYLAAYGLGSPFPEDSKLCAALSTFWPAVAPDAARTFQPNRNWPTVSPLTDEEIGQIGNSSWDGVPGPQRVTKNGKDFVEYVNFAHADYVENSLEKKFSLSLTGQVDTLEYQARVLAMANVYRVLRIAPDDRGAWSVFSFRQVQPSDTELQQAQTQAGTRLQGNIYRFEIYRPGNSQLSEDDFQKRLVEIEETVTLFVTPVNILLKRNNGSWSSRRAES